MRWHRLAARGAQPGHAHTRRAHATRVSDDGWGGRDAGGADGGARVLRVLRERRERRDVHSDATQVVLMREGTRTVLSMQNDYVGPTEAFALVIPVPVVLQEGQVKTLPKAVFAKVDTMGAPRLVEYWEQDPCAPMGGFDEGLMGGAGPARGTGIGRVREEGGLGVTVEAQFAVGEYQIVILSAKDSTGLDAWLRQERYQIPAGAEPLLKPYVESGSKFFVAKVDPTKVIFEGGRAALSPLRFHYDSEEFSLPIRLGLANSSGTQDLIVNILAPAQRYEVANAPNVTIPTNLDVRDSVRTRFGEFYAALFDKTLARTPGAVVTEYAWDASTCDPCPGPTLDGADLQTLGADVIGPGGAGRRFVLTRLHARYGTDWADDLVFKAAPGIVGGREFVVDGDRREEGAKPAQANSFQARYAIRHPWTGALACDAPVRGRWRRAAAGGAGRRRGRWHPERRQGRVRPRGKLVLAAEVASDIPELGVTAGSGATATLPAATGSGSAAAASGSAPGSAAAPPAAAAPARKPGCGCGAGSVADLAGGGVLAALVLFATRRRRRA
ncbi:MAG: DUF2330 domain-containing protein [Kofleriaceae bacterium]